MQLWLDDALQTFTPIKAFRAAHDLTEAFSVNHFEPKDYSELGSISHSHSALKSLYEQTLNYCAIPQALHTWVNHLDSLQAMFRAELQRINNEIGLQPPEIDFAAAGLNDALRAWVYALIRERAAARPDPYFEAVYADWLNTTVSLAAGVHEYFHQGEGWHVQIISHAYGRVGLRVEMSAALTYVQDTSLACPAQTFMEGLLAQLAERIAARP